MLWKYELYRGNTGNLKFRNKFLLKTKKKIIQFDNYLAV